jgi:hypothetical protein
MMAKTSRRLSICDILAAVGFLMRKIEMRLTCNLSNRILLAQSFSSNSARAGRQTFRPSRAKLGLNGLLLNVLKTHISFFRGEWVGKCNGFDL